MDISFSGLFTGALQGGITGLIIGVAATILFGAIGAVLNKSGRDILEFLKNPGPTIIITAVIVGAILGAFGLPWWGVAIGFAVIWLLLYLFDRAMQELR